MLFRRFAVHITFGRTMHPLNRKQRLVLVALAAAIGIMQFLIFEEDGVRGYGWIISFVVIAGALLLIFKEKPMSEPVPLAKAPGSESGTFNDLIFELDRVYRRTISIPPSQDTTTKVIQRDMIFGAINPFAYGLLALKRSIATPDFLSRPEHAELLSMVLKRMVTSRTQIAGGMAAGISIPGLDLSPEIQAIKAKVLEELQAVLNAIAVGNVIHPTRMVEANLLQLLVESAPYVKTNEDRKSLHQAIASFTAGYLRGDAP